MMTSKERMARAMRMEKPDRVPVMCQMSIGHMLLRTGFSPVEFWLSKERFAEGLLQMRAQYGFDGILISLHGHSPDWEKSIVRLVQEDNQDVVYWKDGSGTVFPRNDLPQHFPKEKVPNPSIDDFNPASIPERLDFIPVSQALKFSIDPDHPYDIFDRIIAEAGDTVSIHGEVTSPFDYFLDLFGMSGGFLALADEPDKSKEILQRFTRGVKRIAADQARLGIDALKISSPYAGAGFISPGFYREFVLPYERQVATAVRECGVPVYSHTCGAIHDRLEMMVDSGVSGIECLDPPPLGNVELEEAIVRVGHRIFIKGNIDPVHTLLVGTRETIAADVRRRIQIGRRSGGFILSTACSIAPDTPADHVRMLVPLAEAMGLDPRGKSLKNL